MTREEAIEILKYIIPIPHRGDGKSTSHLLQTNALAMAIKALEQEPKTGHWIEVTNGRGGHKCNLCNDYAPSYQSGAEYLAKYCPSCGAKMIEPQESEE